MEEKHQFSVCFWVSHDTSWGLGSHFSKTESLESKQTTGLG